MRRYTAGASPPFCAMACSDTSSSRMRWSTSYAGARLPVALVSIMTGNAKTMAVRPALERRWDDALAAFDATREVGVLGVPARADTVEELSELMPSQGVAPLRWYGVWLFVDWLEFSGAELDPTDSKQVAATAAVELEASRRDPYRQLSRVFHLVGRKAQD